MKLEFYTYYYSTLPIETGDRRRRQASRYLTSQFYNTYTFVPGLEVWIKQDHS